MPTPTPANPKSATLAITQAQLRAALLRWDEEAAAGCPALWDDLLAVVAADEAAKRDAGPTSFMF